MAFVGKFPAESRVKEGEELDIVFDMTKAHIFDRKIGKAVF
ncbi:hypothetical protein [Palaeococcus ferrophilus]|nr:hypothetical protein [Palaeococcus ferrophilus]